jgi:trans-2,3-dihydro-3-hydroxyanthranilate isomerase
MQAIAREFNLSECVFVLEPRDPTHTARLRIFTPSAELPFAGHPTVGAACLIAELRAPEMLGRQPLQLVLEEELGAIACEVTRAPGAAPRAAFSAPLTPRLCGPTGEAATIAAALGLDASDIGFDGHAPVLATAGLAFAFVPVAGLAALNRIAPRETLFAEAFRLARPAVFAYARETADPAHHVQARVFVPGFGVREDPATGSAAAAFAAVAVAYESPEDGEHVLVIEQGYAMGRPSQIVLTLDVRGGALTGAGIGGQALRVSEGFLHAPGP